MGVVTAWTPYVIIAALLLLTRLVAPIKDFLTGDLTTLPVQNIFGTEVGTNVQLLYSPGSVFLVTVLITYGLYRMNGQQIAGTWSVAGKQLAGTAVALLFALPLVRVLIRSGSDFTESGLDSMPVTLAEGAAAVAGANWPIISPWIGALGAFIAGSNTVSNLTFSLFQFATGEQIGVAPEKVVALQAVGGAAGNPVAIHNIVAASATVGLLGREGDLIRKTALVTFYYCFAGGAIGYMLIYGIGFNAGTIQFILLLLAIAAIVRWMLRRDAKKRATETQDSEQVG
jgi:lactate permease